MLIGRVGQEEGSPKTRLGIAHMHLTSIFILSLHCFSVLGLDQTYCRTQLPSPFFPVFHGPFFIKRNRQLSVNSVMHHYDGTYTD